jgi:hypothetical protein
MKPIKRTKEEVAEYIDRFLSGTGEKWDWDEFTSFPIDDPELEEIRVRAGELPDRYPPDQAGYYCNDQGLRLLEQIAQSLRHGS